MIGEELRIEEVKNQQDLMTFIRFPWEVYQGDPYWVPPLIKDQLLKFDPNHPFRVHSEMILFLAYRGGKVVGRIAGIIDHHYVEFHQEKVGFFGFFESIPDAEVARTLLSRIADWLKGHGMEKMAGPMNPSTNDECGLLIEGFDSSPCLMMPYNPRIYPSLLEGFGLRKKMDLYAYLLEEPTFRLARLDRITERLRKREPQLYVRPIQLRRFDEELKIVKEIYNQAWSKNWGFVPMTDEEINLTAKELKPLVVSELILFAYWGKDPVAFSVSLPDYYEVLKHLNGKIGLLGAIKFLYYSKKINKIRVMLLGVKHDFQKKGVEGLLYIETFKRGNKKGYHEAECSWILEENILMQHGIEAMGGKRYKTYRIYEMPLQ
ncbi:MAG TPA: N-acetyltransferase [Thermodesulfobacteriota bacterium]|nr:N-acetyltransferase [Thermodesulfobacteriota bacterium]